MTRVIVFFENLSSLVFSVYYFSQNIITLSEPFGFQNKSNDNCSLHLILVSLIKQK